MLKSAAPPSRDLVAAARARPLAAMALVVAALTLWRLAWLAASGLDLYVDEAQYWFWGRDLAFGYFSKPPLVGWVIRISTEIGGSSEAFWVRAPGPLLHAATAMILGFAAARLAGPVVGALSGLAYATLPAVALGSTVISTDTVMVPFVAAAIALWLRLADRRSARDAALLGVCVGAGLMAKYAMIYVPICAALLSLAAPRWRIAPRDAAIAAATALLVIAPNIGWNLRHGAITLEHTAHNVGEAERFPRLDSLAEYVGAQFGVMGPVLFAAWLVAAVRGPGRDEKAPLWWFSVPILVIVCLQALRVEANANWGVAACVAGAALATLWLVRTSRRLTVASLAVNGLVALAMPVTTAFPEHLKLPDGRPIYARLMGQDETADEIAAIARSVGAPVVVADNRALLAALAHHLRDDALELRAPRPEGAPDNTYEMAIPLPPEPEGVMLYVGRGDEVAPPEGFSATLVRRWTPEAPFLKGRALSAWRLAPL